MAETPGLDADEALARVRDKQDVSEADVADLLTSDNPRDLQAGTIAIARTALRRAYFALAEFVRAQGYTDQSSLEFVDQLAPLVDTDIPYIEILKGLGIAAAAAGDVPRALAMLQEAINRGFRTGQQTDPLSRTAMRFIHDEEIDRALDTLGAHFAPPRFAPPASRKRVSLLVSAMIDESGPSIVTLQYARALRERGFDIELVSTEHGTSVETWFTHTLRAEGFPLVLTPAMPPQERIRWIIEHYERTPANLVHYMITTMDVVGKVLAGVRCAPAQIFHNFAYEPHAGRFDYIIQGISREQETTTFWPGRSRFLGAFVAMAKEIDASRPMPRDAIGIPDDALMIATFGRIDKCTSPQYLGALGRILSQLPRAYLVLAGPSTDEKLSSVMRYFQSAGVIERVRYLGRRQKDGPALLKATDIYCDTYPWPGGQSLYDAMQAGLPVVAMRRVHDTALDPLGVGASSALAEVTLGSDVPVAPAGDVDAYVRIALAYAHDEAARVEAGERNRSRVLDIAGYDAHMDAVAALFDEAIAQSGR